MKLRTPVKSKSVSSAKSAPQKQLLQSSRAILIKIILVSIAVCGIFLLVRNYSNNLKTTNNRKDKFAEITKPVPTPIPSPSPKPTPKPLTFAEMNSLYGPCVYLPTLMYHHVQTHEAAVANKQTGLTVYTDVFKTQMEYLKSKGYNTISMNDLVNFFDAGGAILAKSVLLTFDDGYRDFFTDAYPILGGLGLKATVFVPTGLMQNPGYLNWNEISGMNSLVLFANHTWSHKNVNTQDSIMQKEILTADTQLSDKGLNSLKVFAYPYGPATIAAENVLNSLGYKLAFTTTPGSTLCKKQRLFLPRVRIGNVPLSNYGF